MNKAKKWMSVLLCVLLVAVQAAGALAEASKTDTAPSIHGAVAQGREASFAASVGWNELPLIDEHTNSLITAVLDSIEITGRYANIDEHSSYMSSAIKISGQDAITYDVVITEEAVYVQTPILGSEPVMFRYDEIKDFYANLGEYMDTHMEQEGDVSYSEMFDAMFENFDFDAVAGNVNATFTEMPAPKEMDDAEIEKNLRQMYAVYGLEGVFNKAIAWTDAEMQAKPMEGDVLTSYDVELESSTITELDKAKLISLMETIVPEIQDNETFWSFLYSAMTKSAASSGQEIAPLDEIMAEASQSIDELMAEMEKLPEDMYFALLEGMDKDGNTVLGQMELVVPDESEYSDGDFNMFAEWLTDSKNFYMEAGNDDGGVSFVVEPKEDLPDGLKDDGFTATFSMIDGGEVVGQLVAMSSSVVEESESGRKWDASLVFGVIDQGEEDTGIEFIVNQMDTYAGDDVHKAFGMTSSLILMGSSLPFISVDAEIGTDEPQGAPFDIETTDFINPATLDADAFAEMMKAWAAGSMKTALGMMSLLPSEVIAEIMSNQMPSTY